MVRSATDTNVKNIKNLIIITISGNEKISIIVGVSSDLINYIRADEIVEQIANHLGNGKGGGNQNLAQTGCKDANKLSDLRDLIYKFILDKGGVL